MVEPNQPEKLIKVSQSFKALYEGRSLIPPDLLASVVSVVGAMSSGKSTLMNSLIGQDIFHVEEQESGALKNATKGIDIFRSDDQIYLDCEGAFKIKGSKVETMQMAAFVSVFSDTILILVSKRECHSDVSTYDKFVMPLFFNRLLRTSTRKNNIIVVVKDLKKKTLNNQVELDKIREDVRNRLRNEWVRAMEILESGFQEWTGRSLDSEFNIYVEFVKFNEDEDKYERTEGITQIIRSDPKSQVFERLQESIDYAKTNILGDIEGAKKELDDKKQEFESRVKDFVISNLVKTEFNKEELEQGIDKLYEEIKTPVCDLFNDRFQRVKTDCFQKYFQMAIRLRLNYVKLDIQYFYFKLELCSLLKTWFDKFDDKKIGNIKRSFEEKLDRMFGSFDLPEEFKAEIRYKINRKKQMFLAVFHEKLGNEKFKSVVGYAIILVTLPLGGGLIGAAAGIGIAFPDISSEANARLQRELEELKEELKNLIENIKKSKGSNVVFEIDNKLKQNFSALDLENALTRS